MLTGQGRKVAVLAVDPSSRRTGGSILADKTRMAHLATDANAFIRPSPTSGTLGGVAAKTRRDHAAVRGRGYDVVLVETVGVGQSEIAVADMTDFFLVLVLPGAGDELQGLKKGVIELADMIAVNKADRRQRARAKLAAAEYSAALHILSPHSPNWSPPVSPIRRSRATASRPCGRTFSTSANGSPHRASSRRGAASSSEMDVGDARRACVRAAALGSCAQIRPAADRGRRRGGPPGAGHRRREGCRDAGL